MHDLHDLGDFLLVDLTEAVHLSESASFENKASVLSYVSEMLSALPEEYASYARDVIGKEALRPHSVAFPYVVHVLSAVAD